MDGSQEFIKWLVEDSTLEEFKKEMKALLKREYCDESVGIIKDSIFNEISEMDGLLEFSRDESDYNLYFEAKQKLLKKITLLSNLLKEYENQNLYEATLEEFGASGVLFARNNYGNIMIENELKKIKNSSEKDIYFDIIELLKKLVQGYSEFNQTKQRMLIDQLKGVYELKDFQIRLLYRYVGSYRIIIGLYIKKTNADSKYRQYVSNAKYQSQGFCDRIENQEIDIDKLIAESTEFYEGLLSEGRNV